jgi:hypothetical protein
MTTVWSLAGVLVALLAGSFLYNLLRGLNEARRESIRRDLIRFNDQRTAAASLNSALGCRVCAFVSPYAEGRTSPIGWLWFSLDAGPGQLPAEDHSGWTLTYRGARRAAGAAMTHRRGSVETIIDTSFRSSARASAEQPVRP